VCEGQWLERMLTLFLLDCGRNVRAAKSENFGEWLFPKGMEEFDCLAMCEDVDEVQNSPWTQPKVDKMAGRNTICRSGDA